AQVDFGAVGKLSDPREMAFRKAYVYIMVLGHSRHQFARIVFDQKLETWLSLHAEAFKWFGGVPEVIVPDNLKAAVLRAAFDATTEPILNRSYRELARHFGFKIDPTPAYSPEKKGKVEAGVRYFKRNFMTTIGAERDIDKLLPVTSDDPEAVTLNDRQQEKSRGAGMRSKARTPAPAGVSIRRCVGVD